MTKIYDEYLFAVLTAAQHEDDEYDRDGHISLHY